MLSRLQASRCTNGISIGKGAVVTCDVARYCIVAGVPAKLIGQRQRDLTYELNFRKVLG